MDMLCAWGNSHQQKLHAAGAKEVLDSGCGHYCCHACMQVYYYTCTTLHACVRGGVAGAATA